MELPDKTSIKLPSCFSHVTNGILNQLKYILIQIAKTPDILIKDIDCEIESSSFLQNELSSGFNFS